MDHPLDQALAMDRMYRYTRHIYDLTRKYYLLGRDRLLTTMDVRREDCVLEVGCGTARNLIRLNRLAPKTRLFGLDASDQMLETAMKSLRRVGLADRISLRQGLAENLDPTATFGLDRPFDAIFFSYSLSMIPTWRQAIDAAMRSLKPGGTIYVVDFGDQAALPGWFRLALKRWLACFHVFHRPELLAHLQGLTDHGAQSVRIEWLLRRYAYIATITKTTGQM